MCWPVHVLRARQVTYISSQVRKSRRLGTSYTCIFVHLPEYLLNKGEAETVPCVA